MDCVSVIIPTYNYGRYLASSLESILSQTYPSLEVIVVDDGSTDDTAQIVRSLAKNGRIRYIHQRRRGVSAARNAGAKAASGSFLAFLDADDVWPCREKLELQVACLEAHPEAGLVFGDTQNFDDAGPQGEPLLKPFGFLQEPSATGGLVDLPLTRFFSTDGFYIPTGTVLLRRAAIESAGLFDEGLQMFEDVECWIRIARRFRIAYVPRVLLHRRIHGQSAGARRHLSYADLQKFLDKVGRDVMRQHGISARGLEAAYLCHTGVIHLQEGDARQAMEAFWTSLRRQVRWKSLAGLLLSIFDVSTGNSRRKGGQGARNSPSD